MWCDSVHPWKDTISPYIVLSEENNQMDSTLQWKYFCKQEGFKKINNNIEIIVLRGFLFVFFFSNFTSSFHSFHLKKLKINQYNFGTGARKKI